MSTDAIARALACAEIARAKRLHILTTLRASMARAGLRAPGLATNPPLFSAPSENSAIPMGTLYSPDLHANRYTWAGGAWGLAGPQYPNDLMFVGISAHLGNGSDPAANPIQGTGAKIRFASWAPMLEILFIYGDAAGGGFRLKVDGEYVHTGLKGNAGDGTGQGNGAMCYIPITWGDGSASQRKLRHYEIEVGSNGRFGGVRMAPQYAPQPWIQPDGLRVLVHGDSMVDAVVDSTSIASIKLHGGMVPTLSELLGQTDCWACGVGSTGWVANQNGARSRFNERVMVDVVAAAPDVIIEIGGKNDYGRASQAELQALVETWISTVLAAKPETMIFMTGPMASRGYENSDPTALAVREAKRLAAANYPQNIAFIDNLAEAWATGSGRVDAPAGDGCADWTNGSDNTHPSVEGSWHLANRLAHGVAKVIPALIVAQ